MCVSVCVCVRVLVYVPAFARCLSSSVLSLAHRELVCSSGARLHCFGARLVVLWTACHHVQASNICFMSTYMPRLQPMAAPAISATSACRPGSNTGRSGGPFPYAPLVQLMSETPSVLPLPLQRTVCGAPSRRPADRAGESRSHRGTG